MKTRFNTGITRFALCAAASAMLAACGGGGSSAPSTAGNPRSAAASLTGTVAIGHALVGAPVTVTDSTGKTATATSGANGIYTVAISNLTAPLLVSAVDKSGASSTTLYSVVASTQTTDGAPTTANVTPLTTAIAALLTKSGSPQDLAASGGLSVATEDTVRTAVTTLDTVLAPILAKNKLSSSFDPVGGTFTTNQTGADAVIDSVSVTPSASGSGLQIASLADPNKALQLNASTTASTTLDAPAQPANYLAALQSQLSQCMTDMQGGATSSAACGTAVDANYRRYGVTSFGKAEALFFEKGVTLTGIKTIAFLPPGTLPAITNPAALVYFLVTNPDGTPSFAPDIVQQKPDGTWDIIGNQQKYDIRIASFLGRIQYTDTARANDGHYESGLDIRIYQFDTQDGTQPQIYSARVQGPGLPDSGAWLEADSDSGLTIPRSPMSGPWFENSGVLPPLEAGMNTTYKWSWAPLSGDTTPFTPGGLPEYAQSPEDVSGISQFGVYTVTLYDLNTGVVTDTEKVLNTAPNLSAAAGSVVPWQTLSTDTIANLLTANGPGIPPDASSVSFNWTVPSADALYPNFWSTIKGVTPPTTEAGQTSTGRLYHDDFFKPTIEGVNYTQIVPLEFPNGISMDGSFPPLLPNAAGTEAGQIELGWLAGGNYYLNTWQFDR
ncbi:hypothetical protein [Paraburkholderia caballeronis]|uniref:Glucoamylase n=1 Tax=Paraburkholderia caballeronis TaxID=416943 RepID=A0A1H7MTS2_9BURK|nr:hypothetical protein [Paraburkholderia caballeronis]PXW26444.1 glucoamylase [Paraburkholderia caballeronis]PXX01991.1 glucoamylase [Paraburkholderia caballeronis]RAK01148.1 glucoamylase [Paraburkholderia caballeronis]SEB95173.1 glucoamylase [Paraburkholderia caballeronis]SEL14075.1 glucoamylase [Paraburkholderia caballeronis]